MSGILRPYSDEDVALIRGSLIEDCAYARKTSKCLRQMLVTKHYIHAMGALTGNQAMQMVKAGLAVIYCSGWQIAADANTMGEMYPDQSLYPVDSMPKKVQSINSTLRRADQIEWITSGGVKVREWFAPVVADAEAGFGGVLNTFELVKQLIKAGAAAVHLEDQLSSAKKCGHMGGKVLVPASEFINKLVAARLASDVTNVPTVIIARTDAMSSRLLTSDIDKKDVKYIARSSPRTKEGFYHICGGMEMAINRGLQYAPYADMIWCETSEPNISEAKMFAEAIHAQFPGKWLAYNCSPSFNWKLKLSTSEILSFQQELAALGYKFQFITLAGFHSLNYGMFKLARDYELRDMGAYADLQEHEFEEQQNGYTAVRHQTEVGTSYYDTISNIVSGDSTLALVGSTENDQFKHSKL